MTPSEKALNAALDIAGRLHRSAFRLSRMLLAGGAKRMSVSKLSVMGHLHRKGPTTATELATYMRIQPQSLTRLVADLERRNWITRRTNSADRRQSLLEITETGSRLLVEDVMAQRTALAQAIVKTLTPAEQEMLRLAAGLMDRLADTAEARMADLPTQQGEGTVLGRQVRRGRQTSAVPNDHRVPGKHRSIRSG